MFVVRPECEVVIPRKLYEDGATAWRAFELAAPFIWFVATYQADGEHDQFSTYCVAWEKDLLDSIEQGAGLVALQLMVPSPLPSNWACMPIASIWKARDPEVPGHDMLIFRSVDNSEFVAPLGTPPSPLMRDHQLVAQI